MTDPPSVSEAVTTLHDVWLRRAHRWEQMVPGLPSRSVTNRQALLRDIAEDLENHLLPYMQLEEQQLAGVDTVVLDLEHGAIRRAVRDLRATIATAAHDPSAAQAALSRLCSILVDHLLHERTAYLARLTTS